MSMCPDCGVDHHPELAEAAAQVDTAEVLAEGAGEVAHEEGAADVRVAEIEAGAAVELARIDAKVQAGWQEARVAELEGQVSGMREVLDRMTAPPDPGPVPEPEPEPEVIEDEVPPPDEEPAPPAPAPKKSKGWWG